MQFHFVAKENVMTKAKSFLVLAIAATAMLASLLEFADARAGERAGEKEESMGLRTVMKELGRNMEAVTGAISREDWALVEELAPGIAHHAQPPAMEKMRILNWLGADAGKFRTLDARVERAANDMAAAAAGGNGQEVIRAFSEVQQACLDCQQQFDKPFVEHFRDRRCYLEARRLRAALRSRSEEHPSDHP